MRIILDTGILRGQFYHRLPKASVIEYERKIQLVFLQTFGACHLTRRLEKMSKDGAIWGKMRGTGSWGA